jgi:hypothetical protein
MYYAKEGIGDSPGPSNTGPERVEKLAPQPNLFYQEKVLLFLAGKMEAFKETTLTASLVEGTQRNELLKGIAAGKYDVAIQMMLANEMSTVKGMTAEQMRQVCTDQVEFLRQEGSERIKKDRFVDAAADIHRTMDRLRVSPSETGRDTPSATIANGTDAVPPLEPVGQGTASNVNETTVEPELETKRYLQEFLQAQLIIMRSRLSSLTDGQSQQYFQTNARIDLVRRSINTLNSGAPFSTADGQLLRYLINEIKTNESSRLGLAQSKVGNEKEQATIAKSVEKLWQMQQYVELHQAKPST